MQRIPMRGDQCFDNVESIGKSAPTTRFAQGRAQIRCAQKIFRLFRQQRAGAIAHQGPVRGAAFEGNQFVDLGLHLLELRFVTRRITSGARARNRSRTKRVQSLIKVHTHGS